MTHLEHLQALLIKTEAELEEIRKCSHPFRSDFIRGWEDRVTAVKSHIAQEQRS